MFFELLREAQRRNNSFLCVGLDPDPALMPGRDVVSFVRAVVEATSDLVCAYKPNLGFFEALGAGGMETLRAALASVPGDIPVIADGKRGDIPSTARFYAQALFEVYGVDAVTVNPYLGGDSLEPFLAYADRGVFVLCRTSNPGASQVQDLLLTDGRHLYEAVAEQAKGWNIRGNVGLVVGATWPEQLARLRALCPDMTFLLPGVGAQGAEAKATVRAALDAGGRGFIISSSRQVLYAARGKGFAKGAREAALALREEINRQWEEALAEAPPDSLG
jgi:orotidine-5'-phosphate decarboxylase